MPAPAFSLWEEVQAHFGLNQAALGRILGLRPEMMYQVATARRPLPLAAAPAFTRLVLALGPLTPAAALSPPAPASGLAAPAPTHSLARHA